jgi:hypothetical protein
MTCRSRPHSSEVVRACRRTFTLMPKSLPAWFAAALALVTIAPALVCLVQGVAPWLLVGAVVVGALRVLWFYTRR